MKFRFTAVLAAFVICSTLLSGCQTISPDWSKGWFGAEKPKVQNSKFSNPVKMAIIWTPAVMNELGRKPIRGFGGRIYFYDTANRPIPVEGQLVIYGYDNARQDPSSKTPDRKYAFTPDQFTGHFSPTQLGASYSVWVPWDEIGNPQLDISLVPIFTSTGGALVVGEGSKSLLPGPTTENSGPHFDHQTLSINDMIPRQFPGPPGVQQVSYLEPRVLNNPVAPRGFSEMTINLPSNLADRLAKADPPATNPPPAIQNPAGQTFVQPATTPTATAERREAPLPLSPLNQPSARFLRPIPPVPSSPGTPPIAGLLPRQPFPGGPQSFPPIRPQPGLQNEPPRGAW